jgi:hypothetical protein
MLSIHDPQVEFPVFQKAKKVELIYGLINSAVNTENNFSLFYLFI